MGSKPVVDVEIPDFEGIQLFRPAVDKVRRFSFQWPSPIRGVTAIDPAAFFVIDQQRCTRDDPGYRIGETQGTECAEVSEHRHDPDNPEQTDPDSGDYHGIECVACASQDG